MAGCVNGGPEFIRLNSPWGSAKIKRCPDVANVLHVGLRPSTPTKYLIRFGLRKFWSGDRRGPTYNFTRAVASVTSPTISGIVF